MLYTCLGTTNDLLWNVMAQKLECFNDLSLYTSFWAEKLLKFNVRFSDQDRWNIFCII